MLAENEKGTQLLEIIRCDEKAADALSSPITHCLAVIKVGDDYLLGWNNWRKDWEIFGGCREESETLRECIRWE